MCHACAKQESQRSNANGEFPSGRHSEQPARPQTRSCHCLFRPHYFTSLHATVRERNEKQLAQEYSRRMELERRLETVTSRHSATCRKKTEAMEALKVVTEQASLAEAQASRYGRSGMFTFTLSHLSPPPHTHTYTHMHTHTHTHTCTHTHTHSLEQTCRDKREEVRTMNNKMEEQRLLQEKAL